MYYNSYVCTCISTMMNFYLCIVTIQVIKKSGKVNQIENNLLINCNREI